MVKEYIATFHSHFGAVRFHREMLKEGNSFSISDPHGEIEQVVEILDIGYKICYSESD